MATWLQQMVSIDWNHESYPAFGDFSVITFFALFFPSLRFLLDTFFFEKVARRLIIGKGHNIVDFQTNERKKKINKFKESAWKWIYYLSAEIFALVVTYDEPWFTNTRYFWVGPGSQIWPDQKIKFARVGSVVLALHEGSDVFLETAKMSKYSGAETIASIAFVIFVLCFTILRIIVYPFWILWSTSYEVVLTLDKERVDGPINYYVFNTLLHFLLVMNIYWWVLMLRMVVKQIYEKGKVSEDIRSDSEDEHKHEE